MTWHPRDPTNKDADMGVEELLDNGSTAPERSQLRWKPAPAIMTGAPADTGQATGTTAADSVSSAAQSSWRPW